jgi:RelE-like toxin of type II toxin-antitoxin system HigB
MLDAAAKLSDLRQAPGNKLHPLKNDRDGQHAIWINDKWRIRFLWTDEAADAGGHSRFRSGTVKLTRPLAAQPKAKGKQSANGFQKNPVLNRWRSQESSPPIGR